MFHLFDITHLIQTAGYIGIFVIIFAESGILLGFFLPGDSLLFTAGFLASQGYFRIELLIPLLFIAAVAGDSVGYLFGRKTGPKIFSREKSWWFHPSNVEKTRAYFDRHGAKTILLARFIPIVRTFAPIMAGVGEMKYRTFAIYNAVGGLVWAVGLTLAGYILGQTVPNADKYILPIVIIIILTSFAPPAWELWKEKRKKKAV